MNRFRVYLSVLALALLFSAAPASATGCAPSVEDGWLRLPPMAMPMLAGFATFANPCADAATIVAARSPAFAEVSLHESRIVDGISQMRPLPEVALAAGGAVIFQPGGKHLMLMDPTAPLQPGDQVLIEFELADGRSISGRFEVRTLAD